MSMIACIIMAVCGMRLPTPKAPSPRAPVQNRRKVTKNLWISVDKIPEIFICVSVSVRTTNAADNCLLPMIED